MFIPEADIRKKANVYRLCPVVKQSKRNIPLIDIEVATMLVNKHTVRHYGQLDIFACR
jgi:hypothetical protein